MISASVFIIIHHLIFNYLQYYDFHFMNQAIMVFNYGCGLDIVLLHGVFVVFEAIVLFHIIGTKVKEFKQILNAEYDLKNVNRILEEKIELRTSELVIAKEEADKANNLKSQFLANMSHEIRTPMNAVIGFTEILKDRVNDGLNKQYVDSIKKSANSLLEIISDILDISKIEAGRLEIQLGLVNPYTLCDEVLNIFKFKVKEKGIELILDVDNSISKALIMDEVRTRQILINLVGNAIKFTDKGYVKIKVTQKPRLMDLSLIDLSFEVIDTGLGISEENLENIFESFTQQTGQNVKKFGGTGLGLSISKKLATMMNGNLTVSSKVNEGTIFKLSLEKVSIGSISLEDNMKKASIDASVFKAARILVVDDIQINIDLVRGFFMTNNSIIFDEAYNGEEAVAKVAKNDYDLIIMDIKMDVMDGLESSKIIKSMKDIPIIILTASVHKKETNEYTDYYDSFLTKPILKTTLLEELSIYLETYDINKNDNKNLQLMILDEDKIVLTSIIEDMKQDLRNGNMNEIKKELERLKELEKNHHLEILIHYIKRFELAVKSFDLVYIEELIVDLETLISNEKK